MLDLARGLQPDVRRALAELAARTVEADGGRLKLEWGTLNTRSGRDVEDVLWWDDDRLVGFLGLYGFGRATVELVGMVDPRARRRGIATALLDAAEPLIRRRDAAQVLLVVPRPSTAGRAFATKRGGVLEHSEHALVLRDAPADGRSDPETVVRPAAPPDGPEVARLVSSAFGGSPSDLLPRVGSDLAGTIVVEAAGVAIGTARLTRDGPVGGVYGFVIDPRWRGRGIGKDVLRRLCHRLREEGASQVGLEVEVDNEAALGLYTSLGFTRVTTEDYYALPLQDQAG